MDAQRLEQNKRYRADIGDRKAVEVTYLSSRRPWGRGGVEHLVREADGTESWVRSRAITELPKAQRKGERGGRT